MMAFLCALIVFLSFDLEFDISTKLTLSDALIPRGLFAEYEVNGSGYPYSTREFLP